MASGISARISTSAVETSSGDALIGLDDRYALDAQGLGWVVSGDGAVSQRPTAARYDGQNLELDIRPLTIPAGARVVVLHFVVTTTDLNQARTLANELLTPDPGDNALEGLSVAEIDALRSQVVNFVIGGQP